MHQINGIHKVALRPGVSPAVLLTVHPILQICAQEMAGSEEPYQVLKKSDHPLPCWKDSIDDFTSNRASESDASAVPLPKGKLVVTPIAARPLCACPP